MPRTSTFEKLMKTFDVESPFIRTSNNNYTQYFVIFIVLVIIGYLVSLYIKKDD